MAQVSSINYGTSTITAAASSAFLNYGNTLANYNHITDMFRRYNNITGGTPPQGPISIVTDDNAATEKKMVPEEPVEREPTLREVWAD